MKNSLVISNFKNLIETKDLTPMFVFFGLIFSLFFTIIIQTLVPSEQTVDICLLFDKILSRLAMCGIAKVDLHYILFDF